MHLWRLHVALHVALVLVTLLQDNSRIKMAWYTSRRSWHVLSFSILCKCITPGYALPGSYHLFKLCWNNSLSKVKMVGVSGHKLCYKIVPQDCLGARTLPGISVTRNGLLSTKIHHQQWRLIYYRC